MTSDLAFVLATGHMVVALLGFIAMCMARDFSFDGHEDDKKWWMSLTFLGVAILWQFFLFMTVGFVVYECYKEKKDEKKRARDEYYGIY